MLQYAGDVMVNKGDIVFPFTILQSKHLNKDRENLYKAQKLRKQMQWSSQRWRLLCITASVYKKIAGDWKGRIYI